VHFTVLRRRPFFLLFIANSLQCEIVEVIAPSLPFPIISIPICLLITLNLYMHYFYAITVPPGFLDDPPRDPPRNSFLWARKVKDKGKQRMISGVRWSAKGNTKITPAYTTKCRKCSKFRPEVSLLLVFFFYYKTSHSQEAKSTVENSPLSDMQ
jgi:palmitoyltransferase